ncbi:uncharacterized protein BX663DRAFT_178993 [Cokeromyces recurvatus]|uniref:uncharacterized protein n=1 Tax=Cokeromyces recurvatus TaxID=90255 RepID=UPI0022207FEC|nr:uncharacterized protein BX663DRAFT_178993 [Cokeromyces recurvatus]KAI7899674.1 hypothetical protein BX663DRAFT_178993 [Cokeromyces recurvatus]
MTNINNVYKCKCSAICSKNPNGFDVISRASYYNHMNNDIPLSNEDNIDSSFVEDNMDVDDSYEDAYDEFEFSQVYDDSNEEESNEGEDPFTRFTYESCHPTEPLALVFFMTLLIFQGKYLNEEGIEILMQCFNEALKIAKCEYRFPTRANTFRDWCQISKFVCGGLQHFVSCITCHAIYPFQTDEEKERTMSKRKCSSRNSSLEFSW